jgi:hypothetical protein
MTHLSFASPTGRGTLSRYTPALPCPAEPQTLPNDRPILRNHLDPIPTNQPGSPQDGTKPKATHCGRLTWSNTGRKPMSCARTSGAIPLL